MKVSRGRKDERERALEGDSPKRHYWHCSTGKSLTDANGAPSEAKASLTTMWAIE